MRSPMPRFLVYDGRMRGFFDGQYGWTLDPDKATGWRSMKAALDWVAYLQRQGYRELRAYDLDQARLVALMEGL